MCADRRDACLYNQGPLPSQPIRTLNEGRNDSKHRRQDGDCPRARACVCVCVCVCVWLCVCVCVHVYFIVRKYCLLSKKNTNKHSKHATHTHTGLPHTHTHTE